MPKARMTLHQPQKGFCGALLVRARLKEMEIALVTVPIRDRNVVEADWCKRSIILAN